MNGAWICFEFFISSIDLLSIYSAFLWPDVCGRGFCLSNQKNEYLIECIEQKNLKCFVSHLKRDTYTSTRIECGRRREIANHWMKWREKRKIVVDYDKYLWLLKIYGCSLRFAKNFMDAATKIIQSNIVQKTSKSNASLFTPHQPFQFAAFPFLRNLLLHNTDYNVTLEGRRQRSSILLLINICL